MGLKSKVRQDLAFTATSLDDYAKQHDMTVEEVSHAACMSGIQACAKCDTWVDETDIDTNDVCPECRDGEG